MSVQGKHGLAANCKLRLLRLLELLCAALAILAIEGFAPSIPAQGFAAQSAGKSSGNPLAGCPELKPVLRMSGKT